MLSERRVDGYRYDKTTDELRLTASGATLPSRDTEANLLLDESGALAGIDLRGEGGFTEGEVWMLAPHESVRGTRAARVKMAGDHVVVLRASALLVVPGANPYLR
jgi:hypothetical protein